MRMRPDATTLTLMVHHTIAHTFDRLAAPAQGAIFGIAENAPRLPDAMSRILSQHSAIGDRPLLRHGRNDDIRGGPGGDRTGNQGCFSL